MMALTSALTILVLVIAGIVLGYAVFCLLIAGAVYRLAKCLEGVDKK